MKDISEKTQQHLRKVYGNIALCSGVCAVAMYLNSATVLSGFIFQLLSFLGMAFAMYKITNVYLAENERMGYMWALSFFMGYLVGPAMHQINMYHPEILY